MKRVKVVAFLLTLMMVFAGCTNSNNSSIDNPNNMQNEPEVNEGKVEPEITEETQVREITEEDWKTIDYINANSHLGGIEFMKKLDDYVNSYNPETGEGYTERSESGLVDGMGTYVQELDGKYITYVSINNNDLESDILGVRNCDTIGDALDKLAKHGFMDYEDNPPYKLVKCKKGRICVVLCYRVETKKSLNEYTIRHVDVVLN